MKNKHGFSFNEKERQEFTKLIVENIKMNFEFDQLVVPQSSNEVLNMIANNLDENYHSLKKVGIDPIVGRLEEKKMQKAQRLKLIKNLAEAKDTNGEVRMANLAANQREIISEYLGYLQSEVGKPSLIRI